MQIHIHFTTAGAGGSGKSLMAFCALAHFIKQFNDHRITNDRVIVIDANRKNPDLYESWLRGYLIAPPISKKTSMGLPFESYQLSSMHQFPIEAVKVEDLTWQWIIEFITKLKEDESLDRSIIHLVIDTDDSPNQLFKTLGTLIFPENHLFFLYPWIIWTNNVFSNQNIITAIRDILLTTEKEVTQKKGYLIPVHVFNPTLLDTRTGWIVSLPELVAIGSYNKYKLCTAGALIPTQHFFEILFSSFIRASAIPEEEKDVYEQIGKILYSRYRTDKECANTSDKCRYANIFCVSVFDRDLAKLKMVPRHARELSDTAEAKVAAKTESIPAIMALPDVLGRVAEDVHYNLQALYEIVSKMFSL